MECHGVAGVVVSCKIPILATRVRFPGDASNFLKFSKLSTVQYSVEYTRALIPLPLSEKLEETGGNLEESKSRQREEELDKCTDLLE